MQQDSQYTAVFAQTPAARPQADSRCQKKCKEWKRRRSNLEEIPGYRTKKTMELLIVLLVCGVIAIPVMAIVALVRTGKLQDSFEGRFTEQMDRIRDLEGQLSTLRRDFAVQLCRAQRRKRRLERLNSQKNLSQNPRRLRNRRRQQPLLHPTPFRLRSPPSRLRPLRRPLKL